MGVLDWLLVKVFKVSVFGWAFVRGKPRVSRAVPRGVEEPGSFPATCPGKTEGRGGRGVEMV